MNNSKILTKHFNELSNSLPSIETLKNASILITGATGFIGSLLTRYFIYLNREMNRNLHIILLVRDLNKAHTFYDSNDVEFVTGDILSIDRNAFSQTAIDYIFHCAAITKSLDMINQPVETAEGIVIGTRNILELARNMKVKSMIYLSSMEVYGSIISGDLRTVEDQLGDINILNSRSCYPLGKRMAENLCYNYYSEYEVPVKIARLAQVFGIGVLREENRVFTQFANAVRKGEDIVLHTQGDSMGNYCDSMDAVSALLCLLFKGDDGEAYNIVNETTTMKIHEMAELVASKVADGKIKVIFDIPEQNKFGYAAVTGLRLSSEKIQKLGWQPNTCMEAMYREMIAWMNYL